MRRSSIRLSIIMPRVAAMILVATSFAVPQVRAAEYPAPLRSLEDAIESSTEDVLLPTSQPGMLTFRNCVEPCKLRALQVSSQSAFFVGDTQVTLAEFNAFIRTAGPQPLMVFRQLDRDNVIRIRVPGQLAPQNGGRKTAPAKQRQ